MPQVLTETAGSAVTAYAYAGGPLELDRSGATNWYLTDTLGSVRLVTDSTGASPATYAYSAFGSTRASTGTLANEVRFSGERTDTESGLEFLRARTYDPSTGTFLQRDSWGITATDSQSIDAYALHGQQPGQRGRSEWPLRLRRSLLRLPGQHFLRHRHEYRRVRGQEGREPYRTISIWRLHAARHGGQARHRRILRCGEGG